MSILAGIPGQLKTLLDRLTSGRAALLDNLDVASSTLATAAKQVDKDDLTVERIENLDDLDATISSRAPATTALLNTAGYWTNARAGYLDLLNTNLDGKISDIAGIPVAASTGEAGQLVCTAQTYTTCVDLTSESGILCLLQAWGEDDTRLSAGDVRVTIDGVSVFGTTGINLGCIESFDNFTDGWRLSNSYFEISAPLIFTDSLKIEAISDVSTCDIVVRWAILKT